MRTFEKKFEICVVSFLKYSFQTPSQYATENGYEDLGQFIDEFFFEVLSKSHQTHFHFTSNTPQNDLNISLYPKSLQIIVFGLNIIFERKSKNLM